MWVRREAEEIERYRRLRKNEYKNPGVPLIISFVIFLITSVSAKLGYHRYRVPSINPISWQEFFARGLQLAFCIGLVSFIVFYLWQILTQRRIMSGATTVICERCGEAKDSDAGRCSPRPMTQKDHQ